jgi:hypothetical protein
VERFTRPGSLAVLACSIAKAKRVAAATFEKYGSLPLSRPTSPKETNKAGRVEITDGKASLLLKEARNKVEAVRKFVVAEDGDEVYRSALCEPNDRKNACACHNVKFETDCNLKTFYLLLPINRSCSLAFAASWTSLIFPL